MTERIQDDTQKDRQRGFICDPFERQFARGILTNKIEYFFGYKFNLISLARYQNIWIILIVLIQCPVPRCPKCHLSHIPPFCVWKK